MGVERVGFVCWGNLEGKELLVIFSGTSFFFSSEVEEEDDSCCDYCCRRCQFLGLGLDGHGTGLTRNEDNTSHHHSDDDLIRCTSIDGSSGYAHDEAKGMIDTPQTQPYIQLRKQATLKNPAAVSESPTPQQQTCSFMQ